VEEISMAGERRYNYQMQHPAIIGCRVCYRAVTLVSSTIVMDSRGATMRCPQCSCNFPVRYEDGAAPVR
jgi:hypothetical protein